MRITESRLRQIVREELTLADYKSKASLETPSAESRATILGDRNMRVRDLEGEIKSAILTAYKVLGDKTVGVGPDQVQWSALTSDPETSGMSDSSQRIVLNVIPGRLWFVLETEHVLSDVEIRALKTSLQNIWKVPAGDTVSNNIIRLSSMDPKQKFTLKIDYPASSTVRLTTGAEDISTKAHIKKEGETLSKILFDNYGLPMTRSNYPIYRLFARNYTKPVALDPDAISNDSIIKIPAIIKLSGGRRLVRKDKPSS